MVDSQARLDELIAKLKERGHRLTPQRMAVLRILAASEGHPKVATLGELHQEVARVSGYQIVSHRLDFFGLCPQCQEEE